MPKLPVRTKVSYGFGAVAEGVKNNAFTSFLLFFYTQVVGLSGALAGTVILLALVVDAVTDPLIGSISDNWHSRWGRRHPFMYAAVVPLATCFLFLFNPPQGWSESGYFWWMLTFAVGVRASMTLYLVPSSAMVAELTEDYDERTSIISFRVMSGWLGGLLAAQLGYLVFFAPSEQFPDGRLNPAAYGEYALAGAVMIVVAILVCALSTHRLIPLLHPPATERFGLRVFLSDFSDAFRSRNYVVLVVAILLVATATGFTEVMTLYVNTYFWELSTTDISFLVLAAALGTLLAFGSTAFIARQSDKRTMALFTMSVIVFVGPLPVIGRLLGIMPDNGSGSLLVVLALYTGLIIYVAVAIMIVVGSMLADTIDQSELTTGKRQEGMFNAAFAFMSKATSGLGGFVAGILLDVVAFPTGAAPGEVDEEVVRALGWGVGPGIFLFWLCALFALSRYSLTRSEHQSVMLELRRRKEQAASKTVSS